MRWLRVTGARDPPPTRPPAGAPHTSDFVSVGGVELTRFLLNGIEPDPLWSNFTLSIPGAFKFQLVFDEHQLVFDEHQIVFDEQVEN